MTTTDPGAVATSERSLAPDLARGGMLLLIALANVHAYVYGVPFGPRGYPADLSGADAVVAAVQLTLVDGRAYPLFALLFGYGIWQLAARRAAVGMPAGQVVALVRRRGWWMLAIGFGHALLLWAGDIVGAYGLTAVLLAALLVTRPDRTLAVTAVVGIVIGTLATAGAALPPVATAAFPSMEIASVPLAALARLGEWAALGVLYSVIVVFGAVALGAWAARRRLLDDPARHRALLVRVAVAGIATGALGGLPLALVVATGATPATGTLLLLGMLHGLSGFAAAVGYAALFGLLAARLDGAPAPGWATALQACGQRSLSCYLAQSVAFVALFPAWTLGLGRGLPLWAAALAGAGVWLVILAVAAVSARRGVRGPAEVLLRRLTYGPRRG